MISKRPATADDIDFVRAVHHRAYREVIEQQYGSWDESVQDKYFAAWSPAAHEIILWDAARCGYVCIEDRGSDLYLRELVIDPDFQCRGIGTQILRIILEQAKARDVPVRLQTHRVNRAANLYRRMGFRETGRSDVHILMEWNNFAP